MKFIRDFDKFRKLKINEALESGQFLAYHRTRLVEQSYIVQKEPDPNVNFYLQFAETMISYKEKNSNEYQKSLSDNIKLLTDMNPDIKLDDRGFPIVKVGDKIITQDPRIISQGFRAGAGDFYGVGLYACYEFDDQIRDFDGDGKVDMAMYGQNIVEFKVENTGKFLILDMTEGNNQAKKVWGSKHTLIDQLKKIMGGKFLNFYNKNKELLDSFNKILLEAKVDTSTGSKELKKDKEGRFLTAPIGKVLCQMEGFISLVDGISFTGGNDGRVLVVYDADLAMPTRYTPDEGKTWIPMAKLEYQYERVKVGNKEILQCKIIDNDKELLQTNSLEWLNSLDFPQILKDKQKSVTFLSKINLGDDESKKYFLDFIEKLSNNKPHVINNIVTRLTELPLNGNLDERRNCIYLSNLVIILSRINISQNSQILNKKIDDFCDYLFKMSSVNFLPINSLVFIFEANKNNEKIKDGVTNVFKNSNSLYSIDINSFKSNYGSIFPFRNYLQIINQMKKFSQELTKIKVEEAIEKMINKLNNTDSDSEFDLSDTELSSFKAFLFLISTDIESLLPKYANDFCIFLAKYVDISFYKRILGYTKHEWHKNKKWFTHFLPEFNTDDSESKFSKNIFIKTISISDKLSDKSIDIMADSIVLYLTTMNDEKLYEFNKNGQDLIFEKVKDSKIFDRIINKLLKLKNNEKVEILGNSNLPFSFDYVYKELSKFTNIDEHLTDLDYDSIADGLFKSMYGVGTKKQDLFSLIKKLRTSYDIEKVKSSFGKRKGMIGREYDLDYWIKDELKQKDLDELNDLLKQKGIKYQF